jgi:hypothetical protein
MPMAGPLVPPCAASEGVSARDAEFDDPEVAPSAAPSASASAAPEPAPRGPKIRVDLEPGYKLEGRPPPKTREAYAADIRERRHWNAGGLGDGAGELPAPEGHPDPRVIINITRVRGGHSQKDVERVVRKFHWINVVRCYRLGAYKYQPRADGSFPKDKELRGWVKARMNVSRTGKVSRPRMADSDLEDEDVARCMVEKLKNVELERAKSGTTVSLEMKVGPGDDPMPPPQELLLPGEGEISAEAMQAGVMAGKPAFEACYREALETAPGLWGRIVIRFHLTKGGLLDEAYETESRFPAPRMQQCVLRAARKLSFQRPKNGEVRFVVPLRFSTDASKHVLEAGGATPAAP